MYDDEDIRPAAVRELFDSTQDLTLKTEIPTRMVLPLLRMKVVLEANNPKRNPSTEPLVKVFRDEYMKIMISFKRKGRLELLGALSAGIREEGEDEVPF